MLNDYVLCITPRDDSFRPSAENVARVIEYLDVNFYLEGPDRDLSALVTLPQREIKNWENHVRQYQTTPVPVVSGAVATDDLPAQPPQPIRKRYVHLLYSPTAPDHYYKNYSELCSLIENLQPRDTAYVAALGRGARNLWRVAYCPLQPHERSRWILTQTINIVSGYHPIWQRMWNQETMHKEYELVTVKAFKILIGCKLNNRVEGLPIEQFVETLQQLPEYQSFIAKIGSFIGYSDLQLLGQDVR